MLVEPLLKIVFTAKMSQLFQGDEIVLMTRPCRPQAHRIQLIQGAGKLRLLPESSKKGGIALFQATIEEGEISQELFELR